MEQSDESLMEAVKKGKLENLGILFDRYNKRIYNYFLRSTLDPDESNDLTQNAFIRVMRYRRSYKVGSSVEAWLFQIARNLVKDHFKKIKVMKDRVEYMEVMPDVGEGANETIEQENRLLQAMKRLPDEKRELLVLSKFQGLKYEQIAAMRSSSVSAVKVQVHRTVNQLREYFFEQENSEI